MWAAFFESLPQAQQVVVEQGTTGFYKVMTAFAAVRLWTGSIPLAYAVQTCMTLAVIGTVAYVGWRRPEPALRNALVCAAVLLSSPYAFDYDFVVLLPAGAFLWRHAQQAGWAPHEKSLLALVWFSPLVARQLAEHLLLPIGLFSALAVAGMALRRIRGEQRARAPALA